MACRGFTNVGRHAAAVALGVLLLARSIVMGLVGGLFELEHVFKSKGTGTQEHVKLQATSNGSNVFENKKANLD